MEGKRFRPYSTKNDEIPIEAVLKNTLVENGKLKSEVAYLENELANKDKAIAAFKEWQKRSVNYHYAYWLNEGLRLIGEQPEEERYRSLRKVIGNYKLFQSRLKLIESTYKNFLESKEFFLKVYKREFGDELQGADEGVAGQAPESDG